MGKKLIWKTRQAMVEKAAAIKAAHFIIKGSEWTLSRKWWNEHIHEHATFEIGDVADSNMETIIKRFWGDVRRLRSNAVREYYQLSASERAEMRERMIATLEAAARPTSQPAQIKQVSVAVELPRQTRQKAAICNATGNDVPIIRDYILRAQIDSALDELNWRQMSTNHLWLDMQLGEVSNG